VTDPFARIVVRPYPGGYLWTTNVVPCVAWNYGRQGAGLGYDSADHALRDAWTWWPELPALVYT
jgi:hypothetical protein